MAGALFGAFLLLTFLGIPISFALGIPAGVIFGFVAGWDLIAAMPQQLLASLDSFPLLAVPIFILAGHIMGTGGVARRLVKLAMVIVGPIRGGLGMVVIVATMFFSGISGSSSADTAAIGSITMPALRQRGYPAPLAASIVAAGGATAVLIPPVIDLVIIGVVANISIAGLFAAGLVPGILNGISLIVLTYLIARRHNLPTEARPSFAESVKAILDALPAVMMGVIILGGIFSGIFTPTEASAVAVVYGLFVSMVVYREMKPSDLPRALASTGRLTGIVLLLVGMASAFGWLLTFERVPQAVAAWIREASGGNQVLFLMLVNVTFLLIGMAMDAVPALIVLMPILTPAAISLGINPIHFGILVEANVALGMITPPVGVVLFVACAMARLPMEAVVRPLLPYMVALFLMLMCITYVAGLTLWLPRLLGYV